MALSSLNEGTPVSLIEAHAAGKAVVSTNVGGIENVVLKNESAFLSDTTSNTEFVEGLYRLSESEELRKEMGEKGRQYVMQHFHYTRLVEDIGRLYRSLLDTKRDSAT